LTHQRTLPHRRTVPHASHHAAPCRTTRPWSRFSALILSVFALTTLIAAGQSSIDRVRWRHLSSSTGDLPVPSTSTQQTGSLVGDFDRDGVNDFVLSFRQVAPALVGYRSRNGGWLRRVIEPDLLTVEADGTTLDIDQDGDLDIVFGGDWQSRDVWWWENPGGASEMRWLRHVIKSSGETQHHDQVFGDFLGTGRPQLAFWNQNAKAIFLATFPAQPHTEPWPATRIFTGAAGEPGGLYPEGADVADVDGDDRVDLLAGNAWFKHESGMTFRPIRIGPIGGRIAAAQLVEGGRPEVVIAPGDGTGPLHWYACDGNPFDPACWQGHDLIVGDVVHGHSLAIADVDATAISMSSPRRWRSGRNRRRHPTTPKPVRGSSTAMAAERSSQPSSPVAWAFTKHVSRI
jgi:hypothetical protein